MHAQDPDNTQGAMRTHVIKGRQNIHDALVNKILFITNNDNSTSICALSQAEIGLAGLEGAQCI